MNSKLPEVALIEMVAERAGPVGTAAAKRLADFARTLGLEIIQRKTNWTFRLAASDVAEEDEVTIFLISAEGTFWIRWLDRWTKLGVDGHVAHEYERQLRARLGDDVMGRQTNKKKGVGLRTVAKSMVDVERIISDAVATLQAAQR